LQFQLTVNLGALLVATIGSISLEESPLKATQMLWVNLIMDSLASLALATEPPTPDLLKRKPYHRKESLISSTMIRNILGQFFYQSILTLTVIYGGEKIFEVPIGRQLGTSANPTVQYTIVFHMFVMMQVFNEIASRKVNNEANIFEGILKNYLFIGIIVFTVVVQFLIVEYGGVFISCVGLSSGQHGACILAGLGGLGVTFMMRYLPPSSFPSISPNEMTEEERERWKSWNRRNSSPFVLSNGKIGRSNQDISHSRKNIGSQSRRNLDENNQGNDNDRTGIAGNITNSSKFGAGKSAKQVVSPSSKPNVHDTV
jgi:hypothetical protein